MIDDIINGINIIRKYTKDKWLSAEHDIVYFGSYEETFDKMTDEERRQMEKMNWVEEYDSWAHYC